MPEYQQTKKTPESKSNIQKQTTLPKQVPISHPAAIIQRARINPKSLTHADVMQLQRTIGNRAVGQLLSEIGLIPSKAKQAQPVQMQTMPEEGKEPLQGKALETTQRQEIPEEEEPLQGKMIGTIQRQEIPEEEESLQGKFESIQRQEIQDKEPLQIKRENNTGMPDNIKAGVESLSGVDMSDVRVHYNSSKPSEVGALAYTQGTDIHVAPGEEKHLPHEAWHVVQQAQGRVRPTIQLKEGMAVNDDPGLELEADTMGEKVLGNEITNNKQTTKKFNSTVIQRELIRGKLNIVGEDHLVSGGRRQEEKNFAAEKGYGGYWTEYEFRTGPDPGLFSRDKRPTGDSTLLRFINEYKFLDEISKNMEHISYDGTNLNDLIDGLQLCDHLISNIKGHLDGIGTEWYQQQTSGFEIDAVKLEKLKSSKPIVDNIIKTQVELWKIINSQISAITTQAIAAKISPWRYWISRMVDYMNIEGNSTDYRILRSRYMRLSAQSDEKIGIWKVGHYHIDDITSYLEQRNIEINDETYTLTTKEEFEQELTQVKAGRQILK